MSQKVFSVCLFGLVSTSIILSIPLHAQTAADTTELVGRLGITFLEEAVRFEQDRPPPRPESQEFNSASEQAIAEYARLRFAYASAQSGGRDLDAIADSITAGSALVGYVPGVLYGLALRGATGYGNVLVDAAAREKSLEYLAVVSSDVLNDLQLDDLSALARDEPERIEEVLIRRTDLLEGIREKAAATGDAELVATTAAAIAQAANDAATQGIILATSATDDVATIDTRLTNFLIEIDNRVDEVETTLDDHETRIDGLETGVDALETSVADMQIEIERLGGNQDLVVDFVFARMSDRERAAAIRTGLIDRFIACPSDAPDCSKADIRGAVAERYIREAEYKETISSIGSVLKDAGTVLEIAGDLNIDVPDEIVQGLSIANAAFTAVTTWSTNPLGAISAITGLFGSKKSAEQKRHEQLMNFLAKNFERINEQLVTIQKNQQTILTSIGEVSEQIAEMHRDLDNRLTSIQRDIREIGQNVERILWRDWSPCRTLFENSLKPFGSGSDFRASTVDKSSLSFLSFEDRVAFTKTYTPEAIDCARKIDEAGTALRTPANWRQEGTFLDLEIGFIQALPDGSGNINDDFRSRAQRYTDDISSSSARILDAWRQRNGLDRLSMLHLLAEQPRDVATLVEMLKRARVSSFLAEVPIADDDSQETEQPAWRFTCDPAIETYPLLEEIVCNSRFENDMAAIYMSAPISTSNIEQVASWAIVAAQVADLEKGSAQYARTLDEVADLSGQPRGERIIATILAFSTIGVVHEQRVHGGWIALAIADDIVNNRPLTRDHHALLSSNNYVAQNVVMLLMHGWLGVEALSDAFPEGVSFQNRYLNAVVYSRSEDPFPLDEVHAIFSDEQDRPWRMSNVADCYDIEAQGRRACYEVSTSEGTVLLPLPGPLQASQGRFAFPRSYESVVLAREMLLERAFAYDMGRADFVEELAAGLRLP